MRSKKIRMLGSFLFACSTILAIGCERAEPLAEDGADEPTLSNIQSSIFDTNCALSGCHAGGNPQQDMSLEDGEAYDDIVNVQSKERPDLLRVDPGNSEGSYLLKKVRGDADIEDARMPLGRSALSNEQIDLIRRWIEDGALDN